MRSVNSSYDRVQRVLKGSSPDYDKAVEAAKEKTFARWGDFKDRVIDVAVNEINSMPEACMNVSYELGKAGRGGKVYEVSFIVKLTSGITELRGLRLRNGKTCRYRYTPKSAFNLIPAAIPAG